MRSVFVDKLEWFKLSFLGSKVFRSRYSSSNLVLTKSNRRCTWLLSTFVLISIRWWYQIDPGVLPQVCCWPRVVVAPGFWLDSPCWWFYHSCSSPSLVVFTLEEEEYEMIVERERYQKLLLFSYLSERKRWRGIVGFGEVGCKGIDDGDGADYGSGEKPLCWRRMRWRGDIWW